MQELMLSATLDSLNGFPLHGAGVGGRELLPERWMNRLYSSDNFSERSTGDGTSCTLDFR
jgi:hypothetical protein